MNRQFVANISLNFVDKVDHKDAMILLGYEKFKVALRYNDNASRIGNTIENVVGGTGIQPSIYVTVLIWFLYKKPMKS